MLTTTKKLESFLPWHTRLCHCLLLQLPSLTQADEIDECSLTMPHAEATQIIGMEKWESLCIKSGHRGPDYSLVILILSVKKHKYIVKFVSLSRWQSEVPGGREDMRFVDFYECTQHSGMTFGLPRTGGPPPTGGRARERYYKKCDLKASLSHLHTEG